MTPKRRCEVSVFLRHSAFIFPKSKATIVRTSRPTEKGCSEVCPHYGTCSCDSKATGEKTLTLLYQTELRGRIHGWARTSDPWLTKRSMSYLRHLLIRQWGYRRWGFWTTPANWWLESNQRLSDPKSDVLTTTKYSSPTALTWLSYKGGDATIARRLLEFSNGGNQNQRVLDLSRLAIEVTPHYGNRHLFSLNSSKNSFAFAMQSYVLDNAIFLRSKK